MIMRWGYAWLLVGGAAALAGYFNPTRDGLLLLTAAFWLFSVFAVGFASQSFPKTIAQALFSWVLIFMATAVFMHFSLPAMSAIPVWLGLLAGFANFLAGRQLSLLAAIGQAAPVVLLGVTAVTRYELSSLAAGASVLAGCLLGLSGSLLARVTPELEPEVP